MRRSEPVFDLFPVAEALVDGISADYTRPAPGKFLVRIGYARVDRRCSDCHLQPLSIGPILQKPKWLSGSYTIRPAASLNNGAPLRIDLDRQHMVNLFTPPGPERPDAGHPAAALVSIAGNAMVQCCAFYS